MNRVSRLLNHINSDSSANGAFRHAAAENEKLMSTANCAATKPSGSAVLPPADQEGLIRHFVAFRYRSSVTKAKKEEAMLRYLSMIDRCKTPQGEPYIVAIEAGFENNDEGFDLGMDVGFIVTFRTAAERDYFVHKDPVPLDTRTYMRPLLNTDKETTDTIPKFIFDFTVDRKFAVYRWERVSAKQAQTPAQTHTRAHTGTDTDKEKTLTPLSMMPFSEHIGVSLISVTKDLVVAELLVREELCTAGSMLHGGAFMAFADSIGAVATTTHLPPGATTTTIESKTNFFAGIPAGQIARAECVALHRGRTTMTLQTKVFRPDGKLAAVVIQTQLVMVPKL